MHDALTSQDIADLERRRLAALVDRDTATAASLHADDYELITPGGEAVSKTQYLGAIADGRLRYLRFEPVGEIRARVHGRSATIRYRVAIVIDWPGGHDEGEFWHTDVWELLDGRWQAVWSHATQIGPISSD